MVVLITVGVVFGALGWGTVDPGGRWLIALVAAVAMGWRGSARVG
jgi:hypothetical protein